GRGLRGDAPLRDAVPDRVSHRRAPAGVGGRDAGPSVADAARPVSRPGAAFARDECAHGHPVVGRIDPADGRPRVRALVGCSLGGRTLNGRRSVSLRMAIVAPPWFAVPPTGYGGIEWVVWLLADGLVDAGHDVTLFASGDSHTKAKLVAVYPEA